MSTSKDKVKKFTSSKKKEEPHECQKGVKGKYKIVSYNGQHNGLHSTTPFLIADSSAIDPSISFEVYRHKNIARRPNYWKVVGSTPFVKYEGYSQGHTPSFATKYAIAMVDNATKSIEWIEPQFFQLSTIPASIKAIDPLTLPAASIVSADAADRKRIANSLGESFGTKKKRQAIKSKERDVVHADMISIAESSSINTSIDKKVKKDAGKPI